MAYTEKNVFGEIVLINLIRIAFVGVCVCFVLPMFHTEIIYLEISELPSKHTLTGFNTIFGIDSSSVSGSPFSLVVFMFPVVAIMVTLMDFLYDYLHIAVLVCAIAGAILTVVYFIAMLIKLNGKTDMLDFTLYELKTGLSWGCLVMLGLYLAIIALSFLYKSVADN